MRLTGDGRKPPPRVRKRKRGPKVARGGKLLVNFAFRVNWPGVTPDFRRLRFARCGASCSVVVILTATAMRLGCSGYGLVSAAGTAAAAGVVDPVAAGAASA